MLYHTNKGWNWFIRYIISIPFIYAVFLPVVLLDSMLELYHHVCFPLYGLKLVDRRRYITFDRLKLKYLNPVDKINCAYCSYVNGFFAYAVEIAGETEKYWCGIRHKKQLGFIEPEFEKEFLPYGDEKSYEKIVSGEK